MKNKHMSCHQNDDDKGPPSKPHMMLLRRFSDIHNVQNTSLRCQWCTKEQFSDIHNVQKTSLRCQYLVKHRTVKNLKTFSKPTEYIFNSTVREIRK